LPEPTASAGELARGATADETGLLVGAYVGTLLGVSLIVFGACVAAMLRRAEGDSGGWWIVALAGIAATSIGIVGDALLASFVRAVGHGASGDSLWLGYGQDHVLGVLVAAPIAVFLLGVGLGGRATRALPRWLVAVALAVAAAFLVGTASITGDEVDGGPLGVPLVLGYVALILWILAVSVRLWRGQRSVASAPEAITA